MKVVSFEDLEVWKKAREVRLFVWKICKRLPAEEKFGLMSQMKRSSRSITNNLAEGYGRYFYQENIQFCRIARGSLQETLDHMIISSDEGLIDPEELKAFRLLHDECLRLLNGYIFYLNKVKNGAS
ncbi:four helix bundle protein [Mariniradius saccharolyticus]|uniref:four helix bundle protein n=1 Tax=Mariniradius saccharolyticus TaxID=1245591 RepID=UPI000313BA30|nr:four helix bundle protein [Mariniradius saccharolyticus]